jgi:hypothetical protein
VALAWETQRLRRQRDSLLRLAGGQAMKLMLLRILPYEDDADDDRDFEAEALAEDCFAGDRKAGARVASLLAKAGLSQDDVTMEALLLKAGEVDRLDEKAERLERRREALLSQIGRRRESFAGRVRLAAEEIVDAEYEEQPAASMPAPSPAIEARP